MKSEDKLKNSDESPPPVFKSWNKLYGFVLFTLFFLIIVFYLFTRAFE